MGYVPNLIIFEIFQGNSIQPLQFIQKVLFEREEDLGAVDPTTISSRSHLIPSLSPNISAVRHLPDSVVSRVQRDDMLRQPQSSLGHLIRGHYGSQIGSCFEVLGWIGDDC